MDERAQLAETAVARGGVYHNNPVQVSEAIGLVMMSLLAFSLLIALLRSEARHRALLREQQAEAAPDA